MGFLLGIREGRGGVEEESQVLRGLVSQEMGVESEACGGGLRA